MCWRTPVLHSRLCAHASWRRIPVCRAPVLTARSGSGIPECKHHGEDASRAELAARLLDSASRPCAGTLSGPREAPGLDAHPPTVRDGRPRRRRQSPMGRDGSVRPGTAKRTVDWAWTTSRRVAQLVVLTDEVSGAARRSRRHGNVAQSRLWAPPHRRGSGGRRSAAPQARAVEGRGSRPVKR